MKPAVRPVFTNLRRCGALFACVLLGIPTAAAADGGDAARLECDLRVAQGRLAAARSVCTSVGAGGGLSDLEAARAAEGAALAEADPARRYDELLKAWSAAERARAAAPDRLVEAGYTHHLAQALRRAYEAIPTRSRPKLRPEPLRWPLAGLPLPAPGLPSVSEPGIVANLDRLGRADERIASVQRRLEAGGPASLRQALEGMHRERSVLWARQVDALEHLIKEDPEASPDYHLHLAAGYAVVDRAKPADIRHTRVQQTLERLRMEHAGHAAARLAERWLVGYAVDAGEGHRARTLMAASGDVDPRTLALYGALFEWYDRPEGAEAEIAKALEPVLTGGDGPGRAVALALRAHAQETIEPSSAAKGWMWVADVSADPAISSQARRRAELAWSAALAAGEPAAGIPADHHAALLVQLLGRGQVDAAAGLLDERLSTGAHESDLWMALALVDALRAADRAADADARLRSTIRALARAPGADPAALKARLEERIDPILKAEAPLPADQLTRLEPLLSAWLVAFPPPPPERVALASNLARAGLVDRASALLRKHISTRPPDRTAALGVLADVMIRQARAAGRAGAATGPWLDGAAMRLPLPREVAQLVAVQSALIAALSPMARDRDALLVDRATASRVRPDRDPLDTRTPAYDPIEDLRAVLKRHRDDALGIEAFHQLLLLIPDAQRAGESRRAARARFGPPTREKPLRALLNRLVKDAGPASTALRQRLFDQAAEAFDAATARPDDAGSARYAAAIAWTLALRADRADAAWQAALKAAPKHPMAADGRWQYAQLLLEMRERTRVRPILESIAAGDEPRRGKALLALIDLYADDPASRAPYEARFVEAFPDHPRAAGMRTRLSEAAEAAPPQDQPAEDAAAAGTYWP